MGLSGFAIASAIGGAASEGGLLIAARAVQGAFAALVAPAALAVVTTTFVDDPRERARAFGVFSGVAGTGVALGLILGGVLTELLSWRWVMYVNVPIAIVAVIGLTATLTGQRAHPESKLDIIGAMTSCGGMVAFVYGLSEAAEWGWGSGLVLGLTGVGVVLIAAFFVSQRKVRHPLLPLRVLADRNRIGALLAVGFVTIGQLAIGLFATYQLQEVMRYSPLTTGLAITPLVVCVLICSVYLVPLLLPRYPARVMVAPGRLLTCAALFVFTQLTPDTSFAAGVLPAEIMLGFGVGLTLSPCTNTATAKIADRDAGAISAFVSSTQQVGSAVGSAFANTIATAATASYFAERGPEVSVPEATIHGNSVAATWTIVLVLATAIAVVFLINARPQDIRPEEDELLSL